MYRCIGKIRCPWQINIRMDAMLSPPPHPPPAKYKFLINTAKFSLKKLTMQFWGHCMLAYRNLFKQQMVLTVCTLFSFTCLRRGQIRRYGNVRGHASKSSPAMFGEQQLFMGAIYFEYRVKKPPLNCICLRCSSPCT